VSLTTWFQASQAAIDGARRCDCPQVLCRFHLSRWFARLAWRTEQGAPKLTARGARPAAVNIYGERGHDPILPAAVV